MLCLLKNAKLPKTAHWFGVLLGWVAALSWLYFSFIEQGLLTLIMSGKALLVDLLLALPITLFFAVILYAMVVWLYKALFIILFKNHIVMDDSSDEDADLSELEELYGKEYWLNPNHNPNQSLNREPTPPKQEKPEDSKNPSRTDEKEF